MLPLHGVNILLVVDRTGRGWGSGDSYNNAELEGHDNKPTLMLREHFQNEPPKSCPPCKSKGISCASSLSPLPALPFPPHTDTLQDCRKLKECVLVVETMLSLYIKNQNLPQFAVGYQSLFNTSIPELSTTVSTGYRL